MKITVDLYYCSQDGGKNKNARFKPSAAFFFLNYRLSVSFVEIRELCESIYSIKLENCETYVLRLFLIP